ncbi:hypothetical protein [Vibrio genomosp. F10]|uniref:hypothetical protein n=1 Tax=Vibrio genomosp. F10 TaxID=723171 RepID=UPI000378136F|nr:hypothetical protein [Vibrio genomosp. F10]OEF08570.1 hypothetical protein A1QI_16220 [Vibrio genomosp. F10 str. 9ZB36]
MKFFPIIILLVNASVHAEYNIFPLSSVVDVNNLYSDSISSVVFEPNTISLNTKNDNSGFEDVLVRLKIYTNIPKEQPNITYISTLTRNSSTCTDYSGDKNEQNEFVSVLFDGEYISESESSEILTFVDDDGENKSGDHIVQMVFRPFGEIITSGVTEECDGAITFNIEIDV